ncbi:hypothetical protein [Enterococcus sp. 2201sp1_2201st1_B8_2201SCRN_220225]|uniref:hypothetical protein n=1 Tax=unclassified Enterococcus TaxID=2608891 RepID=UPI0034A51A15
MTNEEALLIDIKFQLDMYGSGQGSAEDTLARVREIVFSPSLTDDQQVVLEWLKQYREEQGENPLNTVSTLIDMYCADPAGGEVPLPSNVKEAYKKLNDEQEFQVIAAFAEWGLSKMEDEG